MTCSNILDYKNRAEFRKWLEVNHSIEKECWLAVKRRLMTEYGIMACPDLNDDFVIDGDIIDAFGKNPTAWNNFQSFPALYRRVRIDNIQRVRKSGLFESRLSKLIEASEKGQMIGDWNDYGRLLEY